MSAFSRRHYARVSPASETPSQVAARIRMNAVLAVARRERDARFTQITPDNFRDATRWFETRVIELLQLPSADLARYTEGR